MNDMSKKTRTIDFNSIARVLIIKLRHHGDVLLSSPVFQVLKNHYPHLDIDALIYDETADMLSGHPAISELHTIDRSWKNKGITNQISQELKLLKTLRKRKYDLVIHLTNNNHGAWICRLLKPQYAITQKWENKGWIWNSTFSHQYPEPETLRHTVEKHLDALRHLGLHPNPDERRLVLKTDNETEQKINSILSDHGLSNKLFCHFHPTSRWLFKCWNSSKCTALIQALQKRNIPVIITAAPADKELAVIKEITTPISNSVIDLSGQLTLKELAALTSKAKCFVGMDSVPMHIAAAMGTETIAFFGPSGEEEWGPWQVKHTLMTSNYSCRPCYLDGCGGGKVCDCIEAIPVDSVVNAVEEAFLR
jgi:heptosyltransferase-3